ncbi:hypothetical protein [Nocardia sp. NPDC057353]|uniref:FitA-like ribbon-helix-helix domain-containing protein n=1 Tax=Nocardia sp. NPDC057353 TaxID=3346104 RepID=UPI00362798B0
MRAAANGRSTEAEVRAVLTEAVAPEPDGDLKSGSLLAEIGRDCQGPDQRVMSAAG